MPRLKLPLPAVLLIAAAITAFTLLAGADNMISVFQYYKLDAMLTAAADQGILSRSLAEWILDLCCAPPHFTHALYETMNLNFAAIIKYCLVINLLLVLIGTAPGLFCLCLVCMRCAQILKRHHSFEHKSLFNLLIKINWVRTIAFYVLLVSSLWLSPTAPWLTACSLCLYSAGTCFVLCYRRFTPF